MIQMWWKFIIRLRRFFRWLWLQDGTPGYKARGLGLGIFCGCFPLFGFQTLLGITMASLFRGNHILAISGTWVSNPLTYLPLYLFNYRVGSFLLDRSPGLQNSSEFAWKEIWSEGWILASRLLLGSSLVGAFLGLVVGSFIYLILKLRS